MKYRIGHGYDIHRIAPGRPLVLGGVKFEVDFGLEGHSDADCLTHAVCDAFLGAAGLPDIGHRFPNTDPAWRDINSQLLLKNVCSELSGLGWKIENLDVTVIAETPKLAHHISEMKAALGKSTGLAGDAIGIKATTNERVGELGRGLAIAAHAVALIAKT